MTILAFTAGDTELADRIERAGFEEWDLGGGLTGLGKHNGTGHFHALITEDELLGNGGTAWSVGYYDNDSSGESHQPLQQAATLAEAVDAALEMLRTQWAFHYEGTPTEERLIWVLGAFCAAHDLPRESADELLCRECSRESPRLNVIEFLKDYIERWDAAVNPNKGVNGMDDGALREWAKARGLPIDIARAIFEMAEGDDEADRIAVVAKANPESLLDLMDIWAGSGPNKLNDQQVNYIAAMLKVHAFMVRNRTPLAERLKPPRVVIVNEAAEPTASIYLLVDDEPGIGVVETDRRLAADVPQDAVGRVAAGIYEMFKDAE